MLPTPSRLLPRLALPYLLLPALAQAAEPRRKVLIGVDVPRFETPTLDLRTRRLALR